ERLVLLDDEGLPTALLSVELLASERLSEEGAESMGVVGTPDMPLRDALSVMLSQTRSHLVVVDGEGRLAGHVSADLISQELASEALDMGDEPTSAAPERVA